MSNTNQDVAPLVGSQPAGDSDQTPKPSKPPKAPKPPEPIDPTGDFPTVAAFLRMGYEPDAYEAMLEKFQSDKAAALARAKDERIQKEIAEADGTSFMSRELFELRGFRPETYDAQKAKFEEERKAAERLKPPGGPFRVKRGAGMLTAFGANEKRHWAEGEVIEGVSSQDLAHFWKLGLLEVLR